MKMFLLGVYVTGVVVVFLTTLASCILGGNPDDLWRPFVYALGWPVFVIWWCILLTQAAFK